MRKRFLLTSGLRAIFVRASLALVLSVLSFNSFAQEDTSATEEGPTEEGGLSAYGIPSDDKSIDKGRQLFKAECKQCHNPIMSIRSAGPPLEGVVDNQGVEWLRKWIPNAPKMIAEGDEHGAALYKEYGTMMNKFDHLSAEEIDLLIAYINTGGETPVEVKDDGGKIGPAQASNDDDLILILGIVLLVLILIIGILFLFTTHLQKGLKSQSDLSEEDKSIVNERHDLWKVIRHPGFYGSVIALLLVVGLVMLVQRGLYGVGVQTGYAPEQPIPFSHKIHAGQYKIDCNYCHTGVRKAKHANIPSTNICMNCHRYVGIDAGSRTVKSEHLKDLYRYVGYDYKNDTIIEANARPIKWTRIHNIPDLAYYNHSQHVNVAGLECQECHGPVESMSTMYQYSTLTMGWCIDCHRNKSLNLKGHDDSTGYYSKDVITTLMDMHLEDYKKSGLDEEAKFDKFKDSLKVQHIGGLECSKCHY